MKPQREAQVYGVHAARHTLNSAPESVTRAWIQEGRQDNPVLHEILRLIAEQGIPLETMSRTTLDRHTGNAVHQGILLHVKATPATGLVNDLETLIEKGITRDSLFLVLDGLQDPHNLGACLRTADAAGADAVIIPKDRSVQLTPTVSKIASGAAGHTPLISVTNLSRALRQLQDAGVWVVTLAGEAEQDYYQLDLTGPVAVVLGAEGAGVRQNTRKHSDYLASLPMRGIVESLNVSVATGICLYEVLRQRNGTRNTR